MASLIGIITPFLVDLGWNTIGYIYSAIYQTEKVYDAFGTSSYILASLSALAVSQTASVNEMQPRQVILLATTSLWAIRLFSHLYRRVHLLHGDRRFDKVKSNPLVFAVYWFIQSLWVGIVGAPTFISIASSNNTVFPLNIVDFIGLSIWFFGIVYESIADYQKLQWQISKGENRFNSVLNIGLFKYSKYPNYFGEMILWFGSYIIATQGFQNSIPHWIGFLASPVFITFILLNLSGIPILEKMAKERYAGNKEYEEYCLKTPMLIPFTNGLNCSKKVN